MNIPRASMRQTTRLINWPSRVIRRRPLQQIQRQAYSSGGAHGSTEASSDLPWAIGALVVTVPSVSYILWPTQKNNHGHGHGGHEEHEDGEAHVEHNDGTENEGEGTEDGDAQDEHSKGEESLEGSGAGEGGRTAEEGGADEASGTAEDNESDDKASSEEEQGQDTPESSDDDQPASVRDVEEATEGHKEPQFKGPTKDGPPSDHRPSYPDSKGSQKKRIESNYAKPQGPAEGEDAVDYDSDYITDKAAAAKPAGSQTTISGKQEGISNTDTKHSTDILADPTNPKKPEGQPETAKLKGTVDPKRGES